jgi:hypothetical protein
MQAHLQLMRAWLFSNASHYTYQEQIKAAAERVKNDA